MMPIERNPSLYAELVAAGCEIDNHCSDLYVKACPVSRKLVKKHGAYFTTFTSVYDGEPWLDVPFGFEPYWQARAPKPAKSNATPSDA